MTMAPWQRNATVIPASKAPVPTESATQRACVSLLRTYERQGKLAFAAIPNGAALRGNAEERARHMSTLKMLGLRTGAPDLVIILPNRRVAWAELKRLKRGRLSDDQIFWRDLLIGLGHDWCEVRSLDDMKAYLDDLFSTGHDRTPDPRAVTLHEEQ